MSKQRAVSLCGCLAVLPLLIGCSSGVGPSQAYRPAPAYGPTAAPYTYLRSQAYAGPAAPAAIGGGRVYAAGPATPVAVLVLLPAPGEGIIADPQLWTAQGFDVVAPPASELYQIMTNQQTAAARLITAAENLADAPIWLLGPNQAIEAAMASLPQGGQVTGVVMTASTSGAGTCSEQMTYSYSGSGAPKVSVTNSGNACPPKPAFGGGPDITAAPPTPPAGPHTPRLIEASLPAHAASPTAQRAAVQQIADLIKSPPG